MGLVLYHVYGGVLNMDSGNFLSDVSSQSVCADGGEGYLFTGIKNPTKIHMINKII